MLDIDSQHRNTKKVYFISNLVITFVCLKNITNPLLFKMQKNNFKKLVYEQKLNIF